MKKFFPLFAVIIVLVLIADLLTSRKKLTTH